MISCADLEELVADYLDRPVPTSQRPDLQAHLDGCPNCREFMAVYRDTLLVAKRAFENEGATAKAPEELVQRVLASLER